MQSLLNFKAKSNYFVRISSGPIIRYTWCVCVDTAKETHFNDSNKRGKKLRISKKVALDDNDENNKVVAIHSNFASNIIRKWVETFERIVETMASEWKELRLLYKLNDNTIIFYMFLRVERMNRSYRRALVSLQHCN